ncbi:MAG: Transglycosylase [Sphingomonadales bacterium]|jgi:hypothetical protein|nr:Transglycosylase [Sphingomonadales bacterium]
MMGPSVLPATVESGIPARLDGWLLRRRLLQPDIIGPSRAGRPPEMVLAPSPFVSAGLEQPVREGRPFSGRRLLRLAGKFMAGSCLVAVLAPPILGHVRLGTVRAEYAAMNASATAIVVRDRRGRFLGIQPQPLAQGARLYLPSEDVPGDFYRMLRFLEDRPSHNALRNWYGINFMSMLRTGACLVVRETVDGDRRCGGASTLPMQAARGTRGMYGGQDQNWIGRKLRELFDAPSITLMFPEGSIEEQRFTVDSLSYGSAQGFELWGPRLAARVIFGMEPAELSLAQQALLAALPKYRLPLRCGPPSVEQERRDDRSRELIRGRAIIALTGAFDVHDSRALRAIDQLRAMQMPRQPSPLPADMTYGLSPEQACEAAANPRRAAALIASSEMIVARDEIRGAVQDGEGPITEIALTVDISHQRRFKAEVAHLLHSLSVSRRDHLIHALADDQGVADVLLVAARSDGAISFLYNSAARPLFDERRRVGSVAKLVIAAAAARAGISPGSRICNRPDGRGTQNAGGSHGFESCDGAAMVSIEQLFGRSLNLAALELARSIGQNRLTQAAADGGFAVPQQMSAADATALGMAESTPRSMLAFAQAFARGAAGCSASVSAPHIVSRIRIGGQWRAVVPHNLVSMENYAVTPRARQFLIASGGAALRLPQGTLASIVRNAPIQSFEIAKSGTVAGPQPQLATIAKLGVGAAPGRYSWFSLVSAMNGVLGDRHLNLPEFSELIRRRIQSEEIPVPQGGQRPAPYPSRCLPGPS